ncbi:hydroxyacid dehydrogenase [Microbacterium sp. H1-D42]|uniref:hydroxyacid dehydrogenase n=1 Tax=Microbacterium sp. H1-D42 TaxID=2925844 RepID=UPI001F535B79|nr:hydroxyacid dehydrogenase [Microbacterium sp. H1-D42]UNK72249.1 hydroxyacid dehydrogenase [Microbacterium sp. H1-D42]
MKDNPSTLLVMAPATYRQQFGRTELDRLGTMATLGDPICVESLAEVSAERLAHTEVLLTSWGCPRVTGEHLDRMPRLGAIIHAAGSTRHLVPDTVYDRGIVVSSAAAANAVPVAEYTLAAIIFAGKRALPLAAGRPAGPTAWTTTNEGSALSNLGRTIGIVGFSQIGRKVLELLSVLDHGPVLVADPFADADAVRSAGGLLVSLEEVLRRAEILSLHAPLLPTTVGMIGAAQLALLPDGATLINTARGGIVDHDALLAECGSGRLDAILDVTEPEPLPHEHPLRALANVTITPHLAGALGTETRRLTHHALDALSAYGAGADLPGAIDAARSLLIA